MKTLRLPLTFAALLAGATLSAPAATLFVTTLADNGPGSLRRAIVSAADGDTINFKVTGTITLTSGQLVVDKKLNIVGPTPSVFGFNWITVSGNDQSRVFDITATGDVEISNLNVAHGYANVGYPRFRYAKYGGGILNFSKLHLANCSIHYNRAEVQNSSEPVGAGIFNAGDLLVEHCVVAHNSLGSLRPNGVALGVGIGNVGKLKLDSSTIEYNDQGPNDGVGGGLAHADLLNGTPPQQLEIVNCNFYANISGAGAGLSIQSSHDLQVPLIDKTTFAGNVATTTTAFHSPQGIGGAIFAGNSLLIKNSTISGNMAINRGGGISAFEGFLGRQTSLTLNNVTIFGNSVESAVDAVTGNGLGCGISIDLSPDGFPAVLNVANSIVAGNFNSVDPTHFDDINGQVVSLGHNLIQNTTGTIISGDETGNIYGLDPKLGSLSYNGGPTLTHALIQGSPAIDAGDDATAEPTDQRGVTRPVGANSDIGAYEGSIPGRIDINLLYRPVPYIIVCDPAGPYPPFIVTILGDRSFSVRTIDTTSLRLQTRTAAPVAFRYGDVNGDGSVDLVLRFDLNQALQGQDCAAVTQLDLVGTTLTGQDLIGHVQIEAVAR